MIHFFKNMTYICTSNKTRLKCKKAVKINITERIAGKPVVLSRV